MGLIKYNISITVSDKTKLIFICKNLTYVIIWGIVSLLSSYNDIIRWEFDFIDSDTYYETIIAPLLIWTIAFFVDYVYRIWTIGDNEELSSGWVQCSNVTIFAIFVTLLFSIFYHDNVYMKVIWIIFMFLNLILLKTTSLCVIRPVVKLKKI